MKTAYLYRILEVILLLSCLLTMALPMAASAEDTAADADAEYEAKKAAYREKIMADDVTSDDLLIGSWVSFYSFNTDSYEYQLDQMAAAGINFNIFPKDFGTGIMANAEYWEDVEAQYAKRNMIYLMNGSMNEAHVALGLEYAAGKEHCIGYHVVDEPQGSALPEVGRIVRLYRETDQTRYPLVNLFPSYAPEWALGGTYREHVANFLEQAGPENIGYLSHDYYVFQAGGENLGIYADMEVLRSLAYENGKLKTHAFPQSTAWNGMRMPNIDEMRWNVYAYLAYGFKALSWFNIVCPGNSDTEGEGFRDSIIYRDGTIRDPELFAAWSELNWEVRGLSDILMSVDAAHAYHTDKRVSGVEHLPADYFIQTKGSRADFIISDLEPKEEGGDRYIMIFNKIFKKEMDGKFTVDLSGDVKWLEYFDPFTGEYIPVEIKDGVMEVTFRPGEGRVYRLRTDEPPAETEAPTEEVTTEEPTEAPTEAPTAAPTEAPTEAPTDTPAEAPTETEAPKSGCGSFVTVAASPPVLLAAATLCVAPRRRQKKQK